MAVCLHRRHVLANADVERDLARGRLRFEQLVGLLEQRRDFERLRLDGQLFAALQTCNVEEVLDERAHAPGRYVNGIDLFALLRREALGRLQELRGQHDGVERVTEIVRDDCQYLLTGTHGLLRLLVQARVVDGQGSVAGQVGAGQRVVMHENPAFRGAQQPDAQRLVAAYERHGHPRPRYSWLTTGEVVDQGR